MRFPNRRSVLRGEYLELQKKWGNAALHIFRNYEYKSQIVLSRPKLIQIALK